MPYLSGALSFRALWRCVFRQRQHFTLMSSISISAGSVVDLDLNAGRQASTIPVALAPGLGLGRLLPCAVAGNPSHQAVALSVAKAKHHRPADPAGSGVPARAFRPVLFDLLPSFERQNLPGRPACGA